MASPDEELLKRIGQYTEYKRLHLGRQLGVGVHGCVYASDRDSAIKVHQCERPYWRERDVYSRFLDLSVSQVAGCTVPKLLAYDDELMVLEMTIVAPPFVLDFAGAYLDRPPEFPDETMAEWQADKREQFGADWPDVCCVLAALRDHGIHMMDVNPGNVRLRN